MKRRITTLPFHYSKSSSSSSSVINFVIHLPQKWLRNITRPYLISIKYRYFLVCNFTTPVVDTNNLRHFIIFQNYPIIKLLGRSSPVPNSVRVFCHHAQLDISVDKVCSQRNFTCLIFSTTQQSASNLFHLFPVPLQRN